MNRLNAAAIIGAAALSIGTITVAAQTGGAQTTPQSESKDQQATTAQQVTLTGCLRQTSDDPRVFGLVPSQDAQKEKEQATGTAGKMARFPLYRLEDKGQNLKEHVGQRIEVTGKVTPAKDEKGADIVMGRSENIGVPTTTITTIDLKPAPRLDVTSVKKVAGNCPSKPGAVER